MAAQEKGMMMKAKAKAKTRKFKGACKHCTYTWTQCQNSNCPGK